LSQAARYRFVTAHPYLGAKTFQMKKGRGVQARVSKLTGVEDRSWLQSALISRQDRLAFTRNLGILLGAGVTLLKAVDILAEQAEVPTTAEVLWTIKGSLTAGQSLSSSCRLFPGIFSPVYVGLVAVGENTGQIIDCVQQLAVLLEHENTLNQRVKSALVYPAFVVGVTGVLTLFLFKVILPSFMEFFRETGAALPLVTRCLMLVSDLVGSYYFLGILLGAALLVRFTAQQLKQSKAARRNLYVALTRVPGLGKILGYAALARLCWVLKVSISSGIDVLRSLSLATSACGSPLLEEDGKRLLGSIRDGEQLSMALKARQDLYPRLLTQMVSAAEEASDYSTAFASAGRWFEQEVDERVETFKAALEPVLMAGVALIVGGIILSVFLPLYGFLDKLGG
jgi:type IV pilus assembly protein PilC